MEILHVAFPSKCFTSQTLRCFCHQDSLMVYIDGGLSSAARRWPPPVVCLVFFTSDVGGLRISSRFLWWSFSETLMSFCEGYSEMFSAIQANQRIMININKSNMMVPSSDNLTSSCNIWTSCHCQFYQLPRQTQVTFHRGASPLASCSMRERETHLHCMR